MAGIASIFGVGSSRTEISDDEASDFGSEVEPAPEPVKLKQEKKGKNQIEEPEPEESLMVESDDNKEGDEDEEIGEDEYVFVSDVEISLRYSACRYVVEKITNHLVDEVGNF